MADSKETRDQILARHEKETAELKVTTDGMLSKLNANDKAGRAAANKKIAALVDKLRDKQIDELADFDIGGADAYLDVVTEHLEKGLNVSTAETMAPAAAASAPTAGAGKKQSRAQKRREAQNAKEKVKDERRQNETDTKDTKRAAEIQALNSKLRLMGMTLREVAPDGNCLYASIADQLNRKEGNDYNVATLRFMAANYMIENRDDFVAFSAMPSGEFDSYCERVKTDPQAWGSQLELQALVSAMKVAIEVFSADAPTVKMGEEYADEQNPPLQLSYHKFMFTMGEHYNSIVPLA